MASLSVNSIYCSLLSSDYLSRGVVSHQVFSSLVLLISPPLALMVPLLYSTWPFSPFTCLQPLFFFYSISTLNPRPATWSSFSLLLVPSLPLFWPSSSELTVNTNSTPSSPTTCLLASVLLSWLFSWLLWFTESQSTPLPRESKLIRYQFSKQWEVLAFLWYLPRSFSILLFFFSEETYSQERLTLSPVWPSPTFICSALLLSQGARSTIFSI